MKENEDEARFSQHLSMIKKDVELDATLEKAIFNFDSKDETIKFFKEKGFNSLVPKLNMGFQNVAIVNNTESKDKRELKEFTNVKEFFEKFDSQELFVFDNLAFNLPGEGLVCFYIEKEVFCILKTRIEDVVGYFKGKTLVTFDSKILYHKYFDILEDFLFYDLKIGF